MITSRNASFVVILVCSLITFPALAATGDVEFAQLAAYISSSAPPNLQTSLLAKLSSAQAAANRNQPCTATNILGALRNEIAAKTAKDGKVSNGKPLSALAAAKLDTGMLAVNAVLLGMPSAASCGGAAIPPAAAESPVLEVLTNTVNTLQVRVTFPQAHFIARVGNGRPFTDITMEDVGEGGAIGEPHIPRLTKHFAVPESADVTVEVVGSSSYVLPGVDLWPLQAEAVDISLPKGAPAQETFFDRPFQINSKLYSVNAFYPQRPTIGGPLGRMRDLQIGGAEADGAQYNPVSRDLRVYTSLELKITFGGKNTGFFTESRAYSVYNLAFQRIYDSTLINASIIRDLVHRGIYRYCGEEVIVITSQALRPAADRFAAARRAAGYDVAVFETGSGAGQIGTTNAQIQAFIASEMSAGVCLKMPSYLVLFGNTAHVPTFLVPCGPGGDPTACNIASDLPYALVFGGDLFADLAYGRIPVPDLATANAVVDKIVAYETTMPAPAGDDFYRHATTTAYFQPNMICVLDPGATGTPNCDGDHPPVNAHWEIDYNNHQDVRGFTITSERVNRTMRASGYSVDRLYTTDDANVVPLTYWNGTPIPSDLLRPTYPWNADTTDFLNAYNAGRFLILHRDHGWPDGWAAPTLQSSDVPLLTNGTKLPVVFGVNCASAAFDDPTHPSFVELQVIKPDGGAVAGFGDTRVSPSFPNNHMTLGFFDTLFPDTVTGYGSPTPVVHLGEVLLIGKQYMASQEGFEWHGAGDTYVEQYLYHLLGDPTMQMWIAAPQKFDPKKFLFLQEYVLNPKPGDPPFFIKLPPLPDPPPFEGVIATVLQGGQVVGRGIVKNGTVSIAPELIGEGQLTVVLDQLGFLPLQVPVLSPNANTGIQ